MSLFLVDMRVGLKEMRGSKYGKCFEMRLGGHCTPKRMRG